MINVIFVSLIFLLLVNKDEIFVINSPDIFILTIFLICCNNLIVEYLLPSSNILPRTYRYLSTIMKDIGMEYQANDACPNDHIIYYKQYEFEI